MSAVVVVTTLVVGLVAYNVLSANEQDTSEAPVVSEGVSVIDDEFRDFHTPYYNVVKKEESKRSNPSIVKRVTYDRPSGPYADYRVKEDLSGVVGVSRGIRHNQKYLQFEKKGSVSYGDSVLIWSAGKPLLGSLILPNDDYKGRCYSIKINTLNEGKEPCEVSKVLREAERTQKLIYGMGGYRVTFSVINDESIEPLCSMKLERVSCWSDL